MKVDVRANIYRHQKYNYVKILRFYHDNLNWMAKYQDRPLTTKISKIKIN